MLNVTRKELDWGGRRLVLETGKVARQAGGAIMATLGETTVLCTAVAAASAREGIDFFSVGRPSRLKKPPGIFPAAKVFSW